MAKSRQTKNNEAKYRASLFNNKDKRKKARYTLFNAHEALNTRINFGGAIGNDASFSKSLLESTRDKRHKLREAQGITVPNGYDYSSLENEKFVENEKTLCTKIRQPKKQAAERQKKIENSLDKNNRDAVSFERAKLNLIWERYCKQVKQITFRLFESKMKQSKFKRDVLAL